VFKNIPFLVELLKKRYELDGKKRTKTILGVKSGFVILLNNEAFLNFLIY